MATVTLPEFPKDKELEEFVAAYYQCGGLYIDRNVIDRGLEEMFELDIITTAYEADKAPLQRLVEIKGGGWGFSDIFKVRGWMTYLGIENGEFVALKPNEHTEYYVKKSADVGVPVTCIGDWKDAPQIFGQKVDLTGCASFDIENWRFSYWIERNLAARIKKRKKEAPERASYKALDEYLFTVNSRVFLTPGALIRVEKLFANFQANARLSARWGHEEQGEDFNMEHRDVPIDVFKAAYNKCQLTDLALFAFAEHRSRIAIIKSAIDFALAEKAGDASKAGNDVKIKFLETEYKLLDFLPGNFRVGLKEIMNEPFFHRYAVVWQWFLWAFGGFFLTDYEQAEREALADRARIPVEHLQSALDAYGKLFPLDGGWFHDKPGCNIRVMKMMPTPFLGLGANYRRFLHTPDEKLESLKVGGNWTINDLGKWINCAYEILKT